jgi:glycosyltransferase involved in cell wall biosynthesis
MPPERVHTVYLGTDPDWRAATPARCAEARAWLGIPPGRPLVIFIGALGYDSRKGFDTLWTAWRALCARADWDADLVAAGGGRAIGRWQRTIEEAGLASRVRLLGFTHRVADLLFASDLLVSPVRYESYGLNVQEAICCGVPAIVSANAGVAERYPAELGELLIPDPENADDLARRLLQWRSNMEEFRRRTEPMARMLRTYDWNHMAERIVALVERPKAA